MSTVLTMKMSDWMDLGKDAFAHGRDSLDDL